MVSEIKIKRLESSKTLFKSSVLVVSFMYSSFLGALIMPRYLDYISPDTFGVIGIATMISNLVMMFEFGVGAVLVNKLSSDISDNDRSNYLFASFNIYFSGIVVLSSLVILNSTYIIEYFFHNLEDSGKVLLIILLMSYVRILTIPYQSFLIAERALYHIAFEKFIYNTLKFGGGLGLIIGGGNVTEYLILQLVINCLSLMIFYIWCRKIKFSKLDFRSNLSYLKTLFSSGWIVTYSMSVWMLYTHVDKIIYVGKLNLADYGYFMLLNTLVGAAISVSAPLMQIVVPILNQSSFISRDLTSFYSYCCLISFAAITFILSNSEFLISLWLPDVDARNWILEYIDDYVYYIFFTILLSFPYFVLLTQDKLNYHANLHTFFLFAAVPIVLGISFFFEIDVLAKYWKFSSLFILIFWAGYVFKKVLNISFLVQIVYLVIPFCICNFLTPMIDIITTNHSYTAIFHTLLISLIFWFLYFFFVKKMNGLIHE